MKFFDILFLFFVKSFGFIIFFSFKNLNPYESRPIAILRYIGRQANNHTAFICIKTAKIIKKNNEAHSTNTNNSGSNESNNIKPNFKNENSISFVLPVELEVTQQPGIYSPLSSIDFGSVSINPAVDDQLKSDFNLTNSLKQSNVEKVVDLYLTNSAPTSLKITVNVFFSFLKLISF